MLNKGDDCRDAAESCAERKCLDAIGVDGVIVGVDDAREYICPAGVNNSIDFIAGQIGSNSLDLAILDQHVFPGDPGASDDQSTGDDVVSIV